MAEIDIKGYTVLVDDEDVERVTRYKWTFDRQFSRRGLIYVTATDYSRGKKETIKMHRLIMGCRKGDGFIVDHINHNTLDNRKCNLRKCRIAENNLNQRVAKNSSTGYKGVWFRKNTNLYRATVRTKGSRYDCGQYKTSEDAAKAYDKMSLYLFKEFANTNFDRNNYSTEDILAMVQDVEKRRKSPRIVAHR